MTRTAIRGILTGLFIIALLLPVFTVGCGNEEVTLSSVEVYPSGTVQLGLGQVSQFLATATYSDGSIEQGPADVTWSTSDNAVASVGPDGLASAIAVGTATITATLEDQTGSATITVSKLAPTEVTVVDSVGRQVTIPQPLTRVVILHSDGAGAIQALQATGAVVGTSDYIAGKPDAYPLLQNLTKCGSASMPAYESIIALNPQVVITYIGATGYALPASTWDEKLAGTDIKVVGLDFYNPTTLCRDMNTLGVLMGKQQRAAEWVTFVQGYLDKVAIGVASLTTAEKKDVYFESWTDWKSAAEGTGWHDMLVMAGGINIMAGSGATYPVASPEAVLEAGPDVVLKQADSAGAVLGYYATDNTQAEAKRQELISRSGWPDLPAVQNGRVYLVSAEICGGFGKPVCILYLAKALYPDKFADLDPAAFHQAYCEFQGVPYKGIHVYPAP